VTWLALALFVGELIFGIVTIIAVASHYRISGSAIAFITSEEDLLRLSLFTALISV